MAQSVMTHPDVRPFRTSIPEEAIADLRRRIAATRWPERETVADEPQGVQLATMQELVRYWGTEYDFRRFEARLNALPQFITEIDGLDIHFIHVKSPHENALPVIITLGPCPHRACLDRADEAPGISTIRRPRRRLGCADHGFDGCRGTSGVARDSLQHARHGPT